MLGPSPVVVCGVCGCVMCGCVGRARKGSEDFFSTHFSTTFPPLFHQLFHHIKQHTTTLRNTSKHV
jgi:hypothetical protein